jgi:hypothetical protein
VSAADSAVPVAQPTTTRTPLEAIAAACRACLFDPAMPTTWREQIEACSCDWCPLHEHRPRSTTHGATTQAEG